MSWIADKTREFIERHKLDEKWDDFLVKHETFDICLIRTKDFIENWVYPAWHLRNALYYRYDLVRMKRISRKIYCDVEERMLHANMELIVHFIEKENPEKYTYWYQDENGNDVGHKYGENKEDRLFYPEYEGVFVMDIIKEIYDWWTVRLVNMQDDYNYLLSFWATYLNGEMKSKPCANSTEFSEIYFDKSNCPKTLSALEGKDIKWDILDRYLDGDRNNVFVDNFVFGKVNGLELEMDRQKQKYLHLCIEMRPYLWT